MLRAQQTWRPKLRVNTDSVFLRVVGSPTQRLHSINTSIVEVTEDAMLGILNQDGQSVAHLVQLCVCRAEQQTVGGLCNMVEIRCPLQAQATMEQE